MGEQETIKYYDLYRRHKVKAIGWCEGHGSIEDAYRILFDVNIREISKEEYDRLKIKYEKEKEFFI